MFAEALRERGVRVHYFGQLLAETLELPEGRDSSSTGSARRSSSAPSWSRRSGSWPTTCDGASLAEYLVGGVLKADLRPLRAQA